LCIIAGAVYRPHIDGAWPGSGVDEKGALVDDIFGDRTSRLTFLVYLNDSFGGGGTKFYQPATDDVGKIETRTVEPRQGSILVFPHGFFSIIFCHILSVQFHLLSILNIVGDSELSLVHEGSAVEVGAKYVIRTDVLYLNK
jgi:hypothetical protein